MEITAGGIRTIIRACGGTGSECVFVGNTFRYGVSCSPIGFCSLLRWFRVYLEDFGVNAVFSSNAIGFSLLSGTVGAFENGDYNSFLFQH